MQEQLFPFFAERIKLLVRKTKIDLSFDIPHDLPDAWIDKNQVGLVFDGIITNAKEAMHEIGTISIKAVAETVEEHSIHKLKTGRYIRIMIKDSGTGIDKEILPKIFDPFFTTKKFGRGMGLSACYSIVEQHGGAIEVETETGKGTQFTLYFKAAG
jgi:signal transduction histidine kinase